MRERLCLAALLAVTPVSLQTHSSGDTVATIIAPDGTRFEVMAGGGDYALITRGCTGDVVGIIDRVRVDYREAGVAIERGLGRSGVSLGVRGGWVRDEVGADSATHLDP